MYYISLIDRTASVLLLRSISQLPVVVVVVVVAYSTLPRDGGMAENHGAPETGQLLRACARGRRETESRQRASGVENP